MAPHLTKEKVQFIAKVERGKKFAPAQGFDRHNCCARRCRRQ
jgi:hypothetical protein